MSNKVSPGKQNYKCFIVYKDDYKFEIIKWEGAQRVLLRINKILGDDRLLEKCNKIWDKFSKSIKKEFDSEPIQSEKYLGTNKKSYGQIKIFS